MTDQVTRLSLAVDSTQVTRADTELDKFAGSAKAAETAAKGLEAGSKGVGSAMAGIAAGASQANTAQAALARNAKGAADGLINQTRAAVRLESAQAGLAAATGRVALAQEQYNRIAAQTTSTQGAIAAAAGRLQQAQASQAAAAARVQGAQAVLAQQTRVAGAAFALTAQQAQQMSFQLNDLFVQIASGGNPLIALTQQGSQLSGTFGGLGNTLRALATVFTPIRLAIGGVATAALGLAVAAHQGSEESLAFQRAIILTGNAAGVTEGQFNDLAESIAQSTRTTIGSARETLQSLVASGRFSGEALAQAAKGVQSLSKATGQSRDEIIRDFVRAADGPTKFAETANRSLNFLTAKQLEYIRTLEDQGRAQEALAVTFEALNKRTGEAAERVGLLERAWQGVKNAVSGAADALLSIGRDPTTEQRIRSLRAELETLSQVQSPEETSSGTDARRSEILSLIATLEALQKAERDTARASAESAQQNQARIAFDRLREQTMGRQARLAKELADANALADKAGATAAERAAVLAGIREKFAALDSDVNAVAKAKLQADLSAIQEALRNRNEAVRNAQTVFNALRQTGALDDAEAFAAQRAQIRLQADFEIRALQDENARRSQARFAGKEAVRLTIENNAAIAANLQQITRLRGDAAAAERAIDIEQEARTRRRIANLQAERLSLEQSFEAVRRTHELELSLFGRGDAERARAQARAQIEEKFRSDLERLQNEIETKRTAGTATADDEREFEQRRALLRQFLQSSLSEWDAYYERRKEMERDASLGAAEAFARYREEAGNTAKLSEGFFTRGLQRVEDALVEFVTTGKLNWKGLADFIVAEITRIIIKQQIANALASFQGSGNSGAGSAFGTFIQGLFGGARAQGGPVEAGRIYRVNENAGPGEILNVGSRQYLLANQAGRVEPQQSTRQTVNNNSFNIAVPSNTTRETANQLASRAAMQLARASARDN